MAIMFLLKRCRLSVRFHSPVFYLQPHILRPKNPYIHLLGDVRLCF